MIKSWNQVKHKFSHLGIRSKVWLLLLLLAVGFIVVAAMTWIDAGNQAMKTRQNELDVALYISNTTLKEEAADLVVFGTWIAGQKSFADLVLARDTIGLERYLEPLTQTAFTNSVVVADGSGVVLTRLTPEQPASSGDNILNLPGANEGLSGKQASGVMRLPSGSLQEYFTVPIYDASQKAPVGILMLTMTLDSNFAERLSRQVGQQVAIIYDDRIALSTMLDREGRPWIDKIAPPEARQPAMVGDSNGFTTLSTDEGEYLFKFIQLPSPGPVQAALYGIGISTSTVRSMQMDIFRTFAIGLALMGFGIAMLGVLFTQVISRPIQKLLTSTRLMATGNLSHAVAVTSGDELGELAGNLDTMRQNLDRSLQAARLEKSRYAAIIQSMGIPAIVTDHNHRILGVNRASEMLVNRSASSLVGLPLYGLFAVAAKSDQAIPPAWNVGSVGAGGDHNILVHARFPLLERPQTIVDVISTRVDVEGEQGGYVHLLQDVTPQEQVSLAKDEFILNVAHELRAPLSSLRTSIELLLEDYGTLSKRDLGLMLRNLQKASVKFQTLVENMIEIGSIKAGRFRVRPAPIPLDDIVHDAINQTAPLLQSRGQTLELKQQDASGLVVRADRRRVLQVIINLLSNASKYGPEDEPITLSTCRGGGFAFVGVTDCGPGIPADEQDNIFQRYYRSRQIESQANGMGLGLALSKEIVEAHGGSIRVTCAPGLGTTFWFSLVEN